MHDRIEGIWGVGVGGPGSSRGHGKDEAGTEAAQELPRQRCEMAGDFSLAPCLLGPPSLRVGVSRRASRRAGGLGAERLPQEARKGH